MLPVLLLSGGFDSESLRISPKPKTCIACVLLSGTSTATLFGTCTLPAHCFETHFLDRSLQLPLSFYTNARNHSHTSYHTPCRRTCGTGAVLNTRAVCCTCMTHTKSQVPLGGNQKDSLHRPFTLTPPDNQPLMIIIFRKHNTKLTTGLVDPLVHFICLPLPQ